MESGVYLGHERVWRGKGTTTPAQLGLKLVRRLPQILKLNFDTIILADTAFSSIEFLHGVRDLKYHAITGVPADRKLTDGRNLKHLHKLSSAGTSSWIKVSSYCLLVLP